MSPNTALLAACKNGSLISTTLQSLIGRRADIFTRNGDNDTTLMLAIKAGSLTACRALVDHDATIINRTNREQATYLYALILATKLNHTAIARLLIDHDADVTNCNQNGDTALKFAARNNDTELAGVLLDRGADINRQAINKGTALHSAAWKGNVEMVKL